MKIKSRDVVAIVLMFFFGFFLWLTWYSRAGSPVSLAYPPPPTSNYGYPAPPTNTPLPTEEDGGSELAVTRTPTNTPTPWPTPTWYLLSPTPLGTPPIPRQGVASALVNYLVSDRHHLGSWQFSHGPGVPSPYPSNIEADPLLVFRPWGVTSYNPTLPPPLPTPLPGFFQTVATQTPHQYWLVFNECESVYQCATTPALAAQSYADYVEGFIASIDPQAKLIIGGVNAHECGILWLINFMKIFRQNNGRDPLYLAGWHFHVYPGVTAHEWRVNGASCNPEDNPPSSGWPFGVWDYDDKRIETPEKAWAAWQEDVWNIYSFAQEYGQPEHEIWITEMGCLNTSGICVQEGYMYEYVSQVTGWLNSPAGRWIDRYAWYTDKTFNNSFRYTWLYAEHALIATPTIAAGTPTSTPGYLYTALGNYYARITPAPAGEFDELLPEKRYFPIILIP